MIDRRRPHTLWVWGLFFLNLLARGDGYFVLPRTVDPDVVRAIALIQTVVLLAAGGWLAVRVFAGADAESPDLGTVHVLAMVLASIAVVASKATGLPDDRYLAANISPRTLETDQFQAADLVALFREHDIAPSRVVLELTEREAVEDMSRLRESIAACRTAGFRLAADDVGAGNAGLRLLSQIRFDIVEASRILRTSRATLYQRIRAGEIKVQKDGRRSYITAQELQRYVSAKG